VSEQTSAIKRLECPSCGKPVDQHNPTSQTLICSACGSHIGIGTGDAELLAKGGRKLPPPPAPINIGDKFKLLGEEYFVMGRVVYRGWDPSDTSDYWVWNEWLLGAQSGQMVWLSHDETGFALFRKMRFRSQFDIKTARQIDVDGGKKAHINERYPAQIIGAEGELTWRATRGEQLIVAEGAGFGKKYSIQQTADELEVYEGKAIAETELAQATGNAKWEEEIKNRANWTATIGFVALICIIFGVIALVGAVLAGGTGNVILTDSITLSTTNQEASIPVNFEVAERPAIVGINVQTSLPQNTYMDMEVAIISPDGTETDLFEAEFWHETGSDEDGPWQEWEYTGSDMFVPFQTGDHTMKFILGDTPIDTVSANIEIRANHIMPIWLIIYGVIVGGIGLLLIFLMVKRAQAK